MRKLLKILWVLTKWCVATVICLEILAFIAISVSNLILYGHAREGSRAVYDAYTLFLQEGGPRETLHNAVSPNPERNRVVWLFGGSTMRGATLDDDKTIASYLAAYLNAAPDGLRYTVKNYGMNSFNSLLETKYLQKLLIEGNKPPNIVVFYDGANDAKYFAEHRTPYGHHGYRRVRSLIESYYKSWFGLFKPLNAALYSSFSKELFDKIHQVAVPIDPNSDALQKMVTAAVQRYDHVDKMTACYGAEFVLFWQPILWTEECDVPPSVKDKERTFLLNSDRFETVRHNFSLPYLVLADRLKHEPYFVSLRDALCKRTSAAYQPDGVHLTDQGRKTAAIRMGKILEKRIKNNFE
ncbi:MAG: SGNH/GDSL hydrolase family protein [Desulfomonilaceae bacterium]|nr:SGNH/GDSL hydrolase family protein [Desulfomonilaceae bacterium]